MLNNNNTAKTSNHYKVSLGKNKNFKKERKRHKCLQFTQKNPCGISFGGRFFLPVRVQGKADPVTSVVVPEHLLVHQGHSGDDEPQQPDRGQDHLTAGQQTLC